MKQINMYWTVGFVVVALIAGLVAGGALFSTEKEVLKTTTVEVQVPVEVVKEVERLVPLDVTQTYLDKAVAEFLKDKDLQNCTTTGDEYDADQVSIKELSDIWSVSFNESKYLVGFEAKVKYLDSDTGQKCYANYDVTVTYEEGKKPLVAYP